MISFYKYQGAGNDFILIDHRLNNIKTDKILLAQKMCQRRFGIGSDGIIFIEKSASADFKMDFLNPDGSRSFCGNGSRCAVKFAQFLNCFASNQCTFEAIDGFHKAKLIDGLVAIEMKNVSNITYLQNDFFINTGSPHYIKYIKGIDEVDIVSLGREIRYSEPFKKEGTNVNVIEEVLPNQLKVRTYERGVEDETLACGTGVTACALSYGVKHQLADAEILVKALGGNLSVNFKRDHENRFTDIWLTGPAEYVFTGTYDI
jgi:diaminopimelate epimerase